MVSSTKQLEIHHMATPSDLTFNIISAIDEDGITHWFNKGNKNDRDNDLPAIIWADGRKEYWENGKHIKTNKA